MVQSIAAGAAVPRGMLIADAWAQLGDGVAPLSNPSGRPLARTVKLLLDPLVLRPNLNPRFAGGMVGVEHVDELRRVLLDAGPALAATAAWFQLLKKARRRAGVTEGNPQDLYFQRCYELAHEHGDPRGVPDAESIAAEAVAEVRAERGEVTVDRLRRFMTDPDQVVRLAGLLQHAWEDRPAPGPAPQDGLTAFLDTCATKPDERAWKALAANGTGTAEAAELDRPRVALNYGLTARERPAPPALGDRASKRQLPPPFDRSIMERLFAAFTAAFHRESMADIPSMVVGEIHRSAAAWQLAEEPSRVAMALGRDASNGIDYWVDPPSTSDANARLQARYAREAYVHAVHRQPDPESTNVPDDLKHEILYVQVPYLRRLWARLHGRELRGETTAAADVWDLLDGVFRSVLLDQRDRLRRLLERDGGRS
ncbi:hypothetical protein [Glycomyces algeriensis]|uniref:Uncharacterized protein n=1 Tax=Glycomyces algeriensis TaxID=256037 RepID=A0A9W6LE12_9ACTN|nr:hypothetical protein [Glycomyces algeriensis]MDA1368053.1 hypothetical protein [Glycomyces algeriensis]MDR7352563.1 hypothetical protein [Glycomyces algeriensis]GLI40243.1 hypothetical protein GALLR39Z86_00930 [Glycomyces algeriensis]